MAVIFLFFSAKWILFLPFPLAKSNIWIFLLGASSFICSIIQVVGCLFIFDFNISPLYLINTDYRKINKFIVVNFIKITYKNKIKWAVSSVGRASRLHRECRRFETVTAHHFNYKIFNSLVIYIILIIHYF